MLVNQKECLFSQCCESAFISMLAWGKGICMDLFSCGGVM